VARLARRRHLGRVLVARRRLVQRLEALLLGLDRRLVRRQVRVAGVREERTDRSALCEHATAHGSVGGQRALGVDERVEAVAQEATGTDANCETERVSE